MVVTKCVAPADEEYVIYQAHHTCLRGFREAVLDLYPGLSDDFEAWRLLEWLIWSPWRDESGATIMSTYAIRRFLGRGEQQERNWSLRRLCARFSEAVFLIKIGGARPGVARTLISPLPEPLCELMSAEFRSPRATDLVYFSTGRTYTKANRAEERRLMREDARRAVETAYGRLEQGVGQLLQPSSAPHRKEGPDLVLELYEYLNSLPSNRFSRVRDNMAAAHEEAERTSKDRLRDHQILRQIAEQPQPIYAPSADKFVYDSYRRVNVVADKSVRPFPVNPSVIALSRNVREVLMRGCFKVDLSSAHLAIVARLWNALEVDRYLSECEAAGESIWTRLMNSCGLEVCESNKGHLKVMVYSVVYGMGERRLRVVARELFPTLPKFGGRFLRHPVVSSLLRARAVQFTKLRMYGFGIDAFGRQVHVYCLPRTNETYQPDTAASALAIVSQSYELRLMEPLLRNAVDHRGSDGYTILAWLWDGAYLHIHDQRNGERWMRRLQEEVNRTAETLGMHTRLEWEFIP